MGAGVGVGAEGVEEGVGGDVFVEEEGLKSLGGRVGEGAATQYARTAWNRPVHDFNFNDMEP